MKFLIKRPEEIEETKQRKTKSPKQRKGEGEKKKARRKNKSLAVFLYSSFLIFF